MEIAPGACKRKCGASPPARAAIQCTSMMRTARILAALGIVALILAAANWAVRDCPVALLVFENCIWLDVRDALGLPQSKLLRALLLQGIGLALLAGIYFSWKYVYPRRASITKDLKPD
jgi:hypothetical protein